MREFFLLVVAAIMLGNFIHFLDKFQDGWLGYLVLIVGFLAIFFILIGLETTTNHTEQK